MRYMRTLNAMREALSNELLCSPAGSQCPRLQKEA